MRLYIFLIFVGVFVVQSVVSSKNQKHNSRLEWLFGLKNKESTSKEENNKQNEPTMCQSEECKKFARILSESMDTSVDPCENFYDYACGTWAKHNPKPKGMPVWSMFASAQINVMKQINDIFDEGPKNSDLLGVKLAKKWYAVCVNTDEIERYGLEPLVFTISRIGGWPLIMEPDEWNEEEYSWQKVDDQYMRLTGQNAFHDVRVVTDGSNKTQKIIHINIPHLPRNLYRFLGEIDSEENVDESDEDPSNEQKQSGEEDSQEPGSEEDDHNKDDNNNDKDENNGNENDDDDDNNKGDDKENRINKHNGNNKIRKTINTKKTGKITRSKKLEHNKKVKSSTHSKKYKNYNKIKKERVTKLTNEINVRENLRIKKNERKNYVKLTHREKQTKISPARKLQSSEKETIDEENLMKRYADYISKVGRTIAKARGVEVSDDNINKDIQDMIKFQIKLVDITISDETTDIEDDAKMTLKDFQEWYDKKQSKTYNSKINWPYKIFEIFDEAHVSIDNEFGVKISSPIYFERLITLLDETSSRTIVNYIHWNFISRIIKTTTSKMRKLYNAWEDEKEDYNDDDNDENDDNDEEENIMGMSKRSYQCTREVKMSDIIAYEYVRKHFSDEITTSALDMMDDIQKEVEHEIKKSDWMDEETVDFVLAKLVNMRKFIGYPSWYRNDTIVKRYYQGLIIGNSYYENVLSYGRYQKWKELRKLEQDENEEVDENDEDVLMMNPVMVNAFFSPDDNSVALSAADFQSPLFAYNRPQVINYGIVGTIMGHEVNHGFDNDGHLYDKNGELVEWLPTMTEEYSRRANCFVQQFNKYANENNYEILNYGNQTAGENIADTMGVEASFKAYRRRERGCGKSNIILPGYKDLTHEQLFFLAFANLWCEAESNSTIAKAKDDVHSTGRLRVIGTVANLQEFAEAFNCPVGSPMNPEKKCHIWK